MTNLPADELIRVMRAAHEEIREAVAARLEAAREERSLASQPGAEGAGDIGYALDDVAEAPLVRLGETLGALAPTTVIAEGPGVRSYGSAGGDVEPLRVIVDPIDGTRPLMHDMRPAYVLTGIAHDHGDDTRLSHVDVAMQTELPTTTARVFHVLTAVRGHGATIERRDVESGELIDRERLVVPKTLPPDNGFYSVSRFLPPDRALANAVERELFARAVDAGLIEARLMYEDQWLCTAGQLFALATGRYRFLADLRGWFGSAFGVDNFTAKPYDLATSLIFEEAGIVLLGADFAPLDAPLDTSTPLSVVAFGNATLHDAWAPLLRESMESVRAREG